MIKKIIVLAISFVLTLGSVVYTEVSTADPVTYGSGTGVSRTITSVDELTELINSLPNVSVYDEHADVTQAEGYENFKGITIIENGENSKYSNYRTNVRLDDDPDLEEDEIEYFYSRQHEYTNKRLEMYFDTNCIYYHSIGTIWNTVEYFNMDLEGYIWNMSNLEIAKGTATDIDIEVFYSKDRTLMKINQNETYYQEALPTDTYREFPSYKKVEAPTSEDEDDKPTEQEIALKAVNDNLGIWVELDMNATGIDDMEPDYDAIQNMTPEQQEEYMMNFMIQGLLSRLSREQVKSIKEANQKNYDYLASLSSFIVENIENEKYWEVNGPKYTFVPSYEVNGYKCSACQSTFDNLVADCPNCDYNTDVNYYSQWIDDARNAYVKALKSDWYYTIGIKNYSHNGELTLTLGPSTTIKQRLAYTYSADNVINRRSEEITSYSTIFNVDNTEVKALKGAKVKSLDDTYGKSFREAFDALMAEQGGNN